ncbi:hypothetical protein D4T97_015545 [Siminovitchia acidinfaciens]|uniref:Uncharacterized protein n=1 Tax=Siminovitchia acidinfaciens TaxID=2321395 RepID=A0A429XW09_9BACI|nr:hypothetical protein [Siminovitchia acidinfaciens]RST72475.1 hypothetical protein D4T97_015545 [Siminovitchia acidinfaciens]
MDYYTVAICLQILLLLYFEVTTLVPLYPWNDLSKYSPKEKYTEATVNGLIMIIIIGLFITKIKWLMIISVVFWFIFLLMQLLTWWMPYLTGKHLKQFPKSLYESHFKNTVKFLPPIKDHIIPDAQHNVLQIITLLTLLISSISLFI